MNKLNLVILSIVFLVVGLSCSSLTKGKQLAEQAVEKFHAQYNAGQYNDIYNDADDEFKKSVTLDQWTELMEAVHRKLGTVSKSTDTGWNVNTTPSGTFATVS